MSESKSQKVVIVSGSLPPIQCGIGHYTKRLVRALKEGSGTDLSVSVVSTQGVTPDIGAAVIPVEGWGLSNLPSILRAIQHEQPNIVHIEYPAVGYKRQLGINLLPYVLRAKGVATILTLHEYHQSPILGKLRNLVTLLPASHLVVSNHRDYAALRWLKRRIDIIPIGTNLIIDKTTVVSPDEILRRYGLKADHKTLYFFGFPFRSKSVENLVEAMRLLPNYQLLMLSAKDTEDPYHQELQGLVDHINNEAGYMRIAWTGFLDDTTVASALKPGSYFVMPQQLPLTAKSSTPLTAAEHGQIVIAKRGIASDQTPYRHKDNCYLPLAVDPESIAAAINTLDNDTKLRSSILRGVANLQHYFSWDTIAEQHLNLYRSFHRDE